MSEQRKHIEVVAAIIKKGQYHISNATWLW